MVAAKPCGFASSFRDGASQYQTWDLEMQGSMPRIAPK